jgi:hypothetical protein
MQGKNKLQNIVSMVTVIDLNQVYYFVLSGFHLSGTVTEPANPLFSGETDKL